MSLTIRQPRNWRRELAKTKLSYNPLDMMMSGDDAPDDAAITELSPHSIAANPYQPRRTIDDEAQRELVASIEQGGIHEPLIVRPLSEGRYQLVAGGRRLAAALALGLRQVPVVVRDYSDEQAEQVALIENLQRANLRFDDEAVALLKLKRRYKLSNEVIGKSIGKSTDYVELRIAAAENPDALAMYIAGQINMAELMPAIRKFRMDNVAPTSTGNYPKVSDGDAGQQFSRTVRRPHSAFRPLMAAMTTLAKLDAAPLDDSEAEQLVEYALKLRELTDRIIEKRGGRGYVQVVEAHPLERNRRLGV